MTEQTTLFDRMSQKVRDALDDMAASQELRAPFDANRIGVEAPRDPSHGDFATNAAMILAKDNQCPPRQIALALVERLRACPEIAQADVAGPGFVNICLTSASWRAELETILRQGKDYGRSTRGAGEVVNVEYVSANPTGPMHVGHGRGAIVGDVLATLLEYRGHKVVREYYINDAGAQVDRLARSVHLRYLEALGEDIGEIPEGLYPGDYLKPVGAALAQDHGARYKTNDETQWLAPFKERAVGAMMDMIRDDLALLGVRHDRFSSEAALQASGAIDAAVARLRAKGLVYRGVLPPPKGETPEDWEPVELLLFRATAFGDDMDRPLQKSDGSWTYFGADLAYHADKATRADRLIDIWGADHAGAVARQRAAISALTDDRVTLDIRLVQMVRLMRKGAPVKMSKRSGRFITLADVVREVGKDVVRFIMLTRRADAMLDFDFDKVIEQSRDNPVFYVQYAHARIHSLKERAAALGLTVQTPDLSLLDEEDLALVRLAAQWPRIVEAAAIAREPHRIAFFAESLAGAFHALWNRGNDDATRRFLIEDAPELSAARLALARGVACILQNALGVMGVTPAEELR